MKFIDWERLKKLRWVLATDRPEPARQAERIVAMQRDVVLPSKVGVILVVLYYLFFSDWLYEAPTTRSVVQDTLKEYFLVYILCNFLGALFFTPGGGCRRGCSNGWRSRWGCSTGCLSRG